MGSTGTERIAETAKAGADSVFGYIERTAEMVPEGVRWQTLTYENEPQYDASLASGVAGIGLFLAAYYRLTSAPRARELAEGACRWCSAPERKIEGDSLVGGRAGVGLAWLRLANATGDRHALAQAADVAEHLLARDPGPVTGLYSGAAGEGIFLVRLAAATRDERHLAGAARRGAWLAEVALRDEAGPGVHWPYQTDDEPWYGLGFGPGVAGIGCFLLALYEATREARWADLARGAAQTLSAQAKPDHGGLNWPQTIGEAELLRCQLCDGSPGVGLFFVRAYEALGEPRCLETARAAAEATYAYGDVRRNPSQCHGLAGNAELFVELYRLTREPVWLDRAHDFASHILTYRTSTPEGDVWQADEPPYTSPEYLYGAAGTGHFFLRLPNPEDIRMPLL
jgi:lantibiotic modifying enzyme